jgi:hypothetical protein
LAAIVASVRKRKPHPLDGLEGRRVFRRKVPGWGRYQFCDEEGQVLASLRVRGNVYGFTDMPVEGWLYRLEMNWWMRFRRRPLGGGQWETVIKRREARHRWELSDGSRLDLTYEQQSKREEIFVIVTRDGEWMASVASRSLDEDLPIAVLSSSAPDIEQMLPLLFWAEDGLCGQHGSAA